MPRKIKIGGVQWIDTTSSDEANIKRVLEKHDFHELDIEACLEENQRARIDSYDDYLFMVLHFPKYNKRSQSYELNEFNVFLRKNLLITLKEHSGIHIDKIYNKYADLKEQNMEEMKLSSGYILYEIIQTMLEKMFKVIDNITKDLKEIEKVVFEKPSSSLVKQIMIKKRNIVVLKHMFLPQVNVMKLLEFNINKIYKGEMEVYFEDLEDKLEQIVTEIKILEEYTDSIEDAFKSIIDIRTSNIITFLTIFSAFMLPLTFITSFYGMNIDLPFQTNPILVFLLILASVFIMIFGFLLVKKRGKF